MPLPSFLASSPRSDLPPSEICARALEIADDRGLVKQDKVQVDRVARVYASTYGVPVTSDDVRRAIRDTRPNISLMFTVGARRR